MKATVAILQKIIPPRSNNCLDPSPLPPMFSPLLALPPPRLPSSIASPEVHHTRLSGILGPFLTFNTGHVDSGIKEHYNPNSGSFDRGVMRDLDRYHEGCQSGCSHLLF